MRYAVGIDIGGTKVALGVVDERGEVLQEKTLVTDQSVSAEMMTERIAAAVGEVLGEKGIALSAVAGIGIGAPGPLDPKNGVITCPPNLPGWWGFAVVEQMRRHFEVPVIMENDASAAALAEKWVGAAQEDDDFIYITISTGIGAGIVLNGKLYTGFSGNAGDVGHIVIDPSQGTCVCGQKGCFEYLASGTAIARNGSALYGKPMSTKEVFERFTDNDPVLRPYVEQVFTYIGMGCVSLINIFDPQKVVIGGGVSQVGDPLFAAVSDYVSRYALNPTGRKAAVVPAKLSRNVGLVGAAALIFLK